MRFFIQEKIEDIQKYLFFNCLFEIYLKSISTIFIRFLFDFLYFFIPKNRFSHIFFSFCFFCLLTQYKYRASVDQLAYSSAFKLYVLATLLLLPHLPPSLPVYNIL